MRHSDARAVRPYEVGHANFDTPSLLPLCNTLRLPPNGIGACHTLHICNLACHYFDTSLATANKKAPGEIPPGQLLLDVFDIILHLMTALTNLYFDQERH